MRYVYKGVYVEGREAKYFAVHELQDAIEYLRSQPEPRPALIARTKTTVCRYTLRAELRLPPEQLLGKSPDEIWSDFDAEVDLWAAGLEATIPRKGHYDTREGESSSGWR